MKWFIPALLLCVCSTGAFARDVDLDAIYIKKTSPYLPKLTGAKLDLYAASGAVLVADGVSFAGWSSGARLVYTKESAERITLCDYYTSSRRSGVIASIPGGIVYAKMPTGSRYAYLSVLAQGKSAVPESFFVTVDLRTGDVGKYPSRSMFVDYGLTRYGASFIREEGGSLVETFPDTMRKNALLPRSRYGSVVRKNAAVLCYPSPDVGRLLVLAGEGGQYDAAVFEGGVLVRRISGVSSSVDITWIDNSRIAFREGAPGHYAVKLFSCADGSLSQIGVRTMNTNLSYCEYNGILSYLTDGAISFCRVESGEAEIWPIEGEDLSFAPGGNLFCALYGGRLFLVQRETMKSRAVELRRGAAKVLEIYRELLNAPGEWENSFSREYIARKTSLYEMLAVMK